MTTGGTNAGRFALLTLGCKVNQYESHALRERWENAGRAESADISGAETIVVNSCAVTAKAVADVRAAIARAHRAAPDARIIVTGCAAQVFAEELAALPGVSEVVPQSAKESLLGIWDGERPGESRSAPSVSGTPYPAFSLSGYDRARAVLKVQDGCSHHCAYCIVPRARGASRSRALDETLAELRRLLEAGFREITVNGVNLAQYGRDFAGDAGGKHDFWDLVRLLEKEFAPEWAGRARLRMSSLEPGQLTDKALAVIADSRLLAPHIHVSLQSGSASVLQRMGRGHYTADGLPLFFERLREIWPQFGLGADILTGFPGESDDEALATEALCRALPFSYAHVFPYSRRPGTRAAAMEGQLPHAVKKERAARLRAVIAAKKEAFLTQCAALPSVTVALESVTRGRGVNEFYVDCIFAASPAVPARSLVRAVPEGIKDGKLIVRPEGYAS